MNDAPRGARRLIFVDPLPRIVEGVLAAITSLGTLVEGTEVAVSVADAIERVWAAERRGLSAALIAPRNAMLEAPARDALRAASGDPYLESVDVLAAILGGLDGTDGAMLPVIVPYLFVDDPEEIAAACRSRGLNGLLIAKTADIANVGSALDHTAVLSALRAHLLRPSPGVQRLDACV